MKVLSFEDIIGLKGKPVWITDMNNDNFWAIVGETELVGSDKRVALITLDNRRDYGLMSSYGGWVSYGLDSKDGGEL